MRTWGPVRPWRRGGVGPEQQGGVWADSQRLLEHLDPLAALRRLPLEHVAVVGFGRRGELGQICGDNSRCERTLIQQFIGSLDPGGSGHTALLLCLATGFLLEGEARATG